MRTAADARLLQDEDRFAATRAYSVDQDAGTVLARRLVVMWRTLTIGLFVIQLSMLMGG